MNKQNMRERENNNLRNGLKQMTKNIIMKQREFISKEKLIMIIILK